MTFISNQQAGISDDDFERLTPMEKANFAAACGRLPVYSDYQALADRRFPKAAALQQRLLVSS